MSSLLLWEKLVFSKSGEIRLLKGICPGRNKLPFRVSPHPLGICDHSQPPPLPLVAPRICGGWFYGFLLGEGRLCFGWLGCLIGGGGWVRYTFWWGTDMPPWWGMPPWGCPQLLGHRAGGGPDHKTPRDKSQQNLTTVLLAFWRSGSGKSRQKFGNTTKFSNKKWWTRGGWHSNRNALARCEFAHPFLAYLCFLRWIFFVFADCSENESWADGFDIRY